MTTSTWISILALLVAASGWAAFAFEYFSSKPKIQGKIFAVLVSDAHFPEIKKTYKSYMVYLYLYNKRRNSIHILDYQLERKINNEWVRLSRVYNIHKSKMFKDFSVPGSDISIPKFQENLIYMKKAPVEYAKPLHGWVVFYGEPDEIDEKNVKSALYRVTVIDVFDGKHVFEVDSVDMKQLYRLQEITDIQLPNDLFPKSL